MNNKKRFIQEKVSRNFQKSSLIGLLSRTRPENLTVTFLHQDDSKRTLTINEPFFYNDNNERLKPYEIIKKINTLSHDFNAKSYKVTKI